MCHQFNNPFPLTLWIMESAGNICLTPGCDKPASLQCPTCIKLDIEGSFFCSQVHGCPWESQLHNNLYLFIYESELQECFKGFWKEHRSIHKKSGKPVLHNQLLMKSGYYFSLHAVLFCKSVPPSLHPTTPGQAMCFLGSSGPILW